MKKDNIERWFGVVDDSNEMKKECMYKEGSILDRFLKGEGRKK